MGLGETDLWKKQKSKISWHCPFKEHQSPQYETITQRQPTSTTHSCLIGPYLYSNFLSCYTVQKFYSCSKITTQYGISSSMEQIRTGNQKYAFDI